MAKMLAASEIRRAKIVTALNQLEDLKKQATVDRDHFYTGKAVTDTIALLYELLANYPRE